MIQIQIQLEEGEEEGEEFHHSLEHGFMGDEGDHEELEEDID
jgi:hypothetical protein